MRTALLSVAAALPLAVVACNDPAGHVARHYEVRQAATSAAVTGSSSATGAASASGVPGTTAATISAVATTYTFSLASSETTAVPLSSITASATTNTADIPTLATTYIAGSDPTAVDGAPPLPASNLDIGVLAFLLSLILPFILSSASYPPLDITPPTDSDEVKAWIEEVKDSGVEIPDIAVNAAGGCPANPSAATNTSNCWWTCSQCTRDTDITTCPDQGSWGLTFDDGPAPYTPALLSYLDSKELHATFFSVGSRALSYPATLQAEYMAGHQIAGHTWAHPALTTLTNEQIIAELGWTRKVMNEILGVTPNMFRPPYGDIDDRVRAIATAMGMYSVMWTRISATQTFDTHDFDIQSGLFTVEGVLQNWDFILGNASQLATGFIVLEHDLFQQTVDLATGYLLPDAIARGFSITPVVECLHQPLSNAYIETNDNSTNPPAVSGSGVVTLSSPGSAQQTGSSGKNSSGGSSNFALLKFCTPSTVCMLGTILVSLVAALSFLV